MTLRDLRRRLKKIAAKQTAYSDQALGILVCEEALAAAGAKTYGVGAILLDPAGTVTAAGIKSSRPIFGAISTPKWSC